MVCLGILWNSMQEHLEDAVEDIASYGEILSLFSLDLGNNYENFVRDIYAQDDIAEWKVNKKVETMFECSDSSKVTIVFINIETSEIKYHSLKKRNVFVNLENMKTEIRKKYSEIVECYFFDNIFHVTDDEKEYEVDLAVIKNYCNSVAKEDITALSNEYTKVLKKGSSGNGIKK